MTGPNAGNIQGDWAILNAILGLKDHPNNSNRVITSE